MLCNVSAYSFTDAYAVVFVVAYAISYANVYAVLMMFLKLFLITFIEFCLVFKEVRDSKENKVDEKTTIKTLSRRLANVYEALKTLLFSFIKGSGSINKPSFALNGKLINEDNASDTDIKYSRRQSKFQLERIATLKKKRRRRNIISAKLRYFCELLNFVFSLISKFLNG